MKRKTTFIKFSQMIVMTAFFFSVMKIQAQQCVGNKVLIYMDNVTATSNALEYDIFVKNIGTTTLKMAGFGGNVLYGDNFLPIGAQGTLTVVEQPSQTGNFATLNNISPAQHAPATKQLRWAQVPTNRANAVDLPANVALKFARFRFESSIDWDINAETDLTFPTTSTPGITLNVLVVFCEQNTTSAAIAYVNNNLVLQSETASTPSVHVNMFRLLSQMAFESTNGSAYPNPFEHIFKLSETQSNGIVNVEVFDATGRKVEQRSIEASQVSKQEFGQSYPSGFYMVSVTQGNQKQTFKLVKK